MSDESRRLSWIWCRLVEWLATNALAEKTVLDLVETAKMSVSQAVRLMQDEEIDANARCGLGGVSAPGKEVCEGE